MIDFSKKSAGYSLAILLFLLVVVTTSSYPALKDDNNVQQKEYSSLFYYADNAMIQYTGRIDFTNPKAPRFWQPGVSIKLKVKGDVCDLVVTDEMLWGSNHNYIELVVDGTARRMQTKTKRDTISASIYFKPGIKTHVVELVKNTEANIGYMEFIGVRCKKLITPPKKPVRKIECIGNSITCGTGSDMSEIPCGKGKWQDQHNAFMSYGAIMSRSLNAAYHLSSVSGIGLMHSCCNMDVLMPQVYDKISMRDDTIKWNFSRYQPDLVTICLGQNDGIQDSTTFCNNYISFLQQLRSDYPAAVFVLLSSPMANEKLREFMRPVLAAVQHNMNEKGDKKVFHYIFNKQFSSGCDAHPSLQEHIQIADELTKYLKSIMNW